MNIILSFTSGGTELYYQYVVLLTGISGLITIIPAYFLYQRDYERRKRCGVVTGRKNALFAGEVILLLLLGLALALYGNMLVSMLDFLDATDYNAQMELIEEGQSLFTMMLWMGIVAPIAEELIFRWLIFLRLRDYCKHPWVAALITAVLFGIYHGNVVQAIYAAMLGFFFAMVIEWTGNKWSSICLHVGANVCSIFVSEVVVEMPGVKAGAAILYLFAIGLAVLIYGLHYLIRMGEEQTTRFE